MRFNDGLSSARVRGLLVTTVFGLAACTIDRNLTTADTETTEGTAGTEATVPTEATAGTGDGPRFPCGDNGGSCERDSEVCIIGGDNKCSTCVPRPEVCAAGDGCECLPPGTDPVFSPFVCVDAGTCEEVEGQLVLTCATIEWGCG